MDKIKHFGEELRIERIKVHVKKTVLSKEINLSANQINNIEAAPSMQSGPRFLLFLRKKGVDLNALFDKFISEK